MSSGSSVPLNLERFPRIDAIHNRFGDYGGKITSKPKRQCEISDCFTSLVPTNAMWPTTPAKTFQERKLNSKALTTSWAHGQWA